VRLLLNLGALEAAPAAAAAAAVLHEAALSRWKKARSAWSDARALAKVRNQEAHKVGAPILLSPAVAAAAEAAAAAETAAAAAFGAVYDGESPRVAKGGLEGWPPPLGLSTTVRALVAKGGLEGWRGESVSRWNAGRSLAPLFTSALDLVVVFFFFFLF
jgi:hypothetical protein